MPGRRRIRGRRGSPAGEPASGGGAPGGIRALIARHRALAAAAALVAVALVGGGAVALGSALAGPRAAAPAPLPTETATPTPEPHADTRGRARGNRAAPRVRTCSVAALAADPRLANLQAQVMNVGTGEVLFDRGGLTASRTASVMKVLTAAAALAAFAPDHRFATTVVKGAEPGSAVLVGGGDLTLSRTPSGSETVYPGAAHLDDLARQVRAAWNADPVEPAAHEARARQLALRRRDLARQLGPGRARARLHAAHHRAHGRRRPAGPVRQHVGARHRSRRPRRPGVRRRAGGVGAVERGTAPSGAAELGRVWSPTVAQLVDKSLVVSDNTAAEMLARLVAIEQGTGNSFAAIDPAVREALATYGVARGGIRVVDGSGSRPTTRCRRPISRGCSRRSTPARATSASSSTGCPVSGQKGLAVVRRSVRRRQCGRGWRGARQDRMDHDGLHARRCHPRSGRHDAHVRDLRARRRDRCREAGDRHARHRVLPLR